MSHNESAALVDLDMPLLVLLQLAEKFFPLKTFLLGNPLQHLLNSCRKARLNYTFSFALCLFFCLKDTFPFTSSDAKKAKEKQANLLASKAKEVSLYYEPKG